MARYTNADELMLDIEGSIRIAKSKYRELDPKDVLYNPKLTESKSYFDGIIDALHMAQARIIANAPTADVREVVLCKDCKYASSYGIEGTIFCEDMECPNLEDGFCNHAERRGDE